MNVVVNGEAYDFKAGDTLDQLLAELKADARPVAVLVNDEVVRSGQSVRLPVKDGDRVEILTFAAGG